MTKSPAFGTLGRVKIPSLTITAPANPVNFRRKITAPYAMKATSGAHLKYLTSFIASTLLITCGAHARPTIRRTANETRYGGANAPAAFHGLTRAGLMEAIYSLTCVKPPA